MITLVAWFWLNLPELAAELKRVWHLCSVDSYYSLLSNKNLSQKNDS